MWTNESLIVIQDNDEYINAEGTQYPSNYPKDEIAGLFEVVEIARPNNPSKKVTGFHIEEDDGVYTQVWDEVDKTSEELEADLENAKLQKKYELYSIYLEKRAEPIELPLGGVTKMWQADAQAVEAIQGVLVGFPTALPENYGWVAADNTIVEIDREDLQDLATAIVVRSSEYFFYMQTKKAIVRDATTIAQVNAIEWE